MSKTLFISRRTFKIINYPFLILSIFFDFFLMMSFVLQMLEALDWDSQECTAIGVSIRFTLAHIAISPNILRIKLLKLNFGEIHWIVRSVSIYCVLMTRAQWKSSRFLRRKRQAQSFFLLPDSLVPDFAVLFALCSSLSLWSLSF